MARDLSGERVIALSDDKIPGFKVLTTRFLRPAQFTPKFGRSAQSFRSMLAFVGTGEGVALLPELFLPAEPPGLRYGATDSPPFEIFAIWPKDRAAPHVPAYLEILQGKIASARMAPAASKDSPIRTGARRGRWERNKAGSHARGWRWHRRLVFM